MGMQLTEENYYSDIANYEYMSVSQFKDFNGTCWRLDGRMYPSPQMGN